MTNAENYDENNILLLINSVKNIQFKKIKIELKGNDGIKLRFCRKIEEIVSNFQTNNIASNDVSVLIYLI